jgi:hypothetical protein
LNAGTDMSERLIPSKFAGKCRECKRTHGVGELVYWKAGVKGVRCRSCFVDGNGASPTSSPYSPPAAPTGPTSPGKGCDIPANTGTGRHIIREWASFGEYVECAKNVAPVYGEGCWYSPKAKFYGTDSWDDAVQLADNGYSAVRPTVDALVEKMEKKLAPKLLPAYEMFFDVSGGAVDIGRFLDGEPECMVETRLVKVAKPGRVISILVSGGVMQDARLEDILTRGCAIVALVDSLERMQHRAEIWLEMSCAGSSNVIVGRGEILTHLVKLKSAEERLDIDMLMFAIAHPSRHRRLTFAIRRSCDNGRAGIPNEATVALTCKERVGATLCLESLSFGGRTITGEKWVSEKLAEFGLIREDG